MYRVVSTDCNGRSGRYVQAAFKISGARALITALHGVVTGCASIEVLDVKNLPAFGGGRRFTLGRGDIARDVVELVSQPELPVEGGFAGIAPPVAGQELTVWGFPYALIRARGTSVKVATPPYIKIGLWKMSDVLRRGFFDRKSPDPQIDMVDVDGVLLAGHSGGPLVNSANRVVAVANGGLAGGTEHRNWASPLAEVRWSQSPLDDTAVRGLSRASPLLFAYEPETALLPPVATQLAGVGTRGTVSFGAVGYIPGLQGALNPILDSSGRTYLYAKNVAIEGGALQPVAFVVGRPFEVEDSRGNRFSLAVTSITAGGATLSYERLASQDADDVGRFQTQVSNEAQTPVAGATVQVTFSDGTSLFSTTNAGGLVVFERLKRPVADVSVAHANFVAGVAPGQDLRTSLGIQLRGGGGGSVTLNDNIGQIPGLSGRLNPHRDSENRTYIHADNIAVARGQREPVPFKVNVPFELEDRYGNRFSATVTSITNSASTMSYQALPAEPIDDVARFEVKVADDRGAAVSGASVAIVFRDGTMLSGVTNAQGIAGFDRLKQPNVDVYVGGSGYSAVYQPNHDGRQPAAVVLRRGQMSSGIFVGRSGNIPGLRGTLNPIWDREDLLHLYAGDKTVNGSNRAPAGFVMGQPLTIRDAVGTTFEVTFVAKSNYAWLFNYRKVGP